MAQRPEDPLVNREDIKREMDGDSVVISGISGIYPQANNIKELSNILYDKINPIRQKTRWQIEHPEIPKYLGLTPNAIVDRFDAQFFKVHQRQAKFMDSMACKILEQTFHAIYDSGVHVNDLSGKNVGVYIASAYSDSEKGTLFETSSSHFILTGVAKTMMANRISYWLNLKGPSMEVEGACAGSMVALERAYLAIKRGECEAAIVGGCSIYWHPQIALFNGRITPLSKDGRTKSFDQNADGFVKSEAINILFLQKAKNALRVYAEVVNVETEFHPFIMKENRPKYGFHRDPNRLSSFLERFYVKAGISSHDVEYVEAFGCAVPEIDKVELEVFDKVFCGNRTRPLLVGSVVSNIGHTDTSSGIASITKVLLGYETGIIAGNLHCETPRQDVQALKDGRMRIVTEHQPFNASYVAVNNLSLSGINSHVLLRGFRKPKDITLLGSTSRIPRLITVSGRQELNVEKILDYFKSHPIDPEELALLYNLHKQNISGHMGRGYAILDTNDKNETVNVATQIDYFEDMTRPLWFVYSGMGSQWPGMGVELMRIPTFAAAIERCQKVLKPKGLDLIHIITTRDENIFDNILHSFVGIIAIQIGLTDVLKELGLIPDNIIGHSVGEAGCAYADGCFTAEEAIQVAYIRGIVSIKESFIRGSMAAVGVGYEKISKLCPPEIVVACHNGPDSSTISGPAEAMKRFITKLKNEGVFAKEVPCSNIAYHSKYIAAAGQPMLKSLGELLKEPKPRSERWISTSIPVEKWNDPDSKLSSAWYHTHNFLNPVLFEEALRMVPSNAVLVEVAPHGLLQAILKRSLPKDCTNIPLTKRGHPNNASFFLENIGKLYVKGYNVKINNLYPKIKFPVSTGTPLLSHLVEWNHEEQWKMPIYLSPTRKSSTNYNFIVFIYDDDHSYLQGNVIKGKVLYPFAAALVAVWDTLAMAKGVPKKQFSVKFQDVHLYSQPIIHKQRLLNISVNLLIESGQFQVTDGFAKLATGFIKASADRDIPRALIQPLNTTQEMDLTSSELYKVLQKKEYLYSGDFLSIHKSNKSFTEAYLAWNNNWTTLIDGMIQMNILGNAHHSVSQPNHIRTISIYVKTHENNRIQLGDKTAIPLILSKVHDYTRCGGIFMETIQFKNLPSTNADNLLSNTSNHEFQNVDLKIAMPTNVTRTLQCAKIGDLDSIQWIESSVSKSSGSGIKVKIEYAAINDLDIRRATGAISFTQNSYGMDYSGITESGERVMGIVPCGAASTFVTAVKDLMWPVPPQWTLEDAATVPLAYAQAFYCLGIRSRLLPGMTVFVHGGAGALGQAVISVALANGCEVFTTVGDIRKKVFLRRLFPDLKGENIGNSRDNTFGDMIMQATDGQGCDIVISCVKGELINTTLKCAAFSGITFDTSQVHSDDSYAYGMYYMTKQRSFVLVDFASVFESKEDMKDLQVMLSEGIARGYVRPLTRMVYPYYDAPRAFRLQAARNHRGRVLLSQSDDKLASQSRYRASKEQLMTKPDGGIQISLLHQLAKIADIVIKDEVKESETLKSLGLADAKLEAIRVFLQNTMNISIDDEFIPLLTVERIRDMEKYILMMNEEMNENENLVCGRVKGLQNFFSQVDSNELVASTSIVYMPTLINQKRRTDEFDRSQDYMFIVPGMDGQHLRFAGVLSHRLKIPSIVLQPGLDYLWETPKETAQRYFEILLQKFEVKDDFHILGYEVGVMTALELASILEDKGLTGTVFCVGGSPAEIQTTINEELRGYGTEESLRGAVARHMSSLMAGEQLAGLEYRLRNAASWQEVVDACVLELRGRVKHSMQYSRLMIEAAVARIQKACTYNIEPRALRSRLVMLRTTSMHPDTSPSHALQNYSQQPVIEYNLNASLANATNNLFLPTYVNRHLSTRILEAYERKNLCETFLIDNVKTRKFKLTGTE